MTTNPRIDGAQAERRARRFLEKEGLRLRERNFRTRFGEVDLIMDDGEVVVFIEVRYRTRATPVAAHESVDEHKQRRLTAAAELYLQRYPGLARRPCRFDVVAAYPGTTESEVQWLRGAFDAR